MIRDVYLMVFARGLVHGEDQTLIDAIKEMGRVTSVYEIDPPSIDTLKPGTVWRHMLHQTRYTIVTVANADASVSDRFPVTVVYRDEDDKIWARPADEFLQKFGRIK